MPGKKKPQHQDPDQRNPDPQQGADTPRPDR